MRRRARFAVYRGLCVAFVVATLCAHAVAALGDGSLGAARAGGLGLWTLAHYGVLTVLMLGAWLTSPRENGSGAHHWAVAAGLFARLSLIPVASWTSNDAERYLWDGRVALAGVDPYRRSPDAPELAALRRSWPTPPEHSAYPTLYPPAALATFALAASAGPDHAWLAWKSLATAAGVATLLLAVPLLRRAGRMRHLPLVALSPLLVLETGVGAHVDAFSTLSVAAALLATQRSRPALAGALLGIGGLYKLLPTVAILPVALAFGSRGAAVRAAAAGLASFAAGYAVAVAAGFRPVGSAPVFFERWRFGSPLFSALELLPAVVLAGVIALGLLAGLGTAAHLARRRTIASVQLALTTPLLLSPVVFPWYPCVLVPGLALAPSGAVLAWVVALPLTHEVLGGFAASGAWSPATWPLLVTGAAFGAGVAFDWRRGRRID